MRQRTQLKNIVAVAALGALLGAGPAPLPLDGASPTPSPQEWVWDPMGLWCLWSWDWAARSWRLTDVAATDLDPAPSQTTLTAFLTGYTWWDNTPPGSPAISHPSRHATAGGTGTYSDPLTVAVGHSLASGADVLDWPEGTLVYVDDLQLYGVVEDTCGDGPTPQTGPCHSLTQAPSGAETWLDLWVGGQAEGEAWARRCAETITRLHRVQINPPPGLPVGSLASTCR